MYVTKMGSHPASGGYKYRCLVLREGGWAWGQQLYPVKKKIVEKPPRNSAGFCGGGKGLSWTVEPRKEEDIQKFLCNNKICNTTKYLKLKDPYFMHMGF
jgi:hypothetical protein